VTTIIRKLLFTSVVLLAGGILLSACSSPSAASGAPATPPTASVTATTSPATGAVSASPAAVQKVNANTASQAEIQQALEAAGIPNAARWAREVVEYRPYPTDDPSFARLRQELAKYNPAPGVVDQIIATLTL
jgi:hypothetical protein